MAVKTRLEELVEETLRPVLGALLLLKQEMADTMGIPDNPSQVLNKPYEQITEQELMALFDIYHVGGETEPCAMCFWTTKMELSRARKDKEEFGG